MELRVQDNKGYASIMALVPRDATILDLACGCGNPFKGIKFPLLVGVDIYRKNFHMPEYDAVLCYDIRKITDLFYEKSFDVVTAIDTIEHLEKKDGFKLIEDAEKLAREKTIFFTPVKWTKNKEAVEKKEFWSYSNPYNYHHSLWIEDDFIDRGYSIIPFQGYVLAEKVLK